MYATKGTISSFTMSRFGRTTNCEPTAGSSITKALRPAPTTKDIADWLDGKDDVRRSKGELGEIVDGVNKGTAKWALE